MSAEKLGVKHTTISGAAEVAGEALKIFDSTISASGGAGVYLSSLSETVRANLRMKRSTVSNNLDGALGAGGDINLGTLHGMNIPVSQSTISANARFGLASDLSTVTAVRSQVRGEGTDATCGTSQACADLAASVAPRVSSAADCDTSYVAGSGIPGADWDICALD
jgi:hypothetical protein